MFTFFYKHGFDKITCKIFSHCRPETFVINFDLQFKVGRSYFFSWGQPGLARCGLALEH